MSDTLDRIEYDLFLFTNNETGLTTFVFVSIYRTNPNDWNLLKV